MKKILSLILVLMLAISVAAVAEGSEKKDSWLCDEKTTLTVFCDEGASNTMPVPSNDLPFWAWLEDYTNVHIDGNAFPAPATMRCSPRVSRRVRIWRTSSSWAARRCAPRARTAP